jgi:hypothetical protein
MKDLLIFSLLLFLLEGCAVMNTFQTPKTKQPGKVSVGIGGGVNLVESDNRDFDYPVVPFDTYLRVGIVPRVDVGLRTAGFIAYGADIKYQLLKTPFPVSINAGFGTGQYEHAGFGSSGKENSTTKFVGIIAGYEPFYYGFKLTDYYYRDEETGDQSNSPVTVSEVDKFIPAATFGFAAPESSLFSPMFEINTYFLPQVITTANLGLKVNF